MKSNRGFTLIEVMVVMAIITILAALIIGTITLARKTGIETTHRYNAKSVSVGLEGYRSKTRNYIETGNGSGLNSCPWPVTQVCWNGAKAGGYNHLENVVNTGTWVTGGVKLSDQGVRLNSTPCTNGGGRIISTLTRVVIVPVAADCATELWADSIALGG